MDVATPCMRTFLSRDGTQTAAAAAAAAAVPRIRPRSIIVSDFTQIQADLFVSDTSTGTQGLSWWIRRLLCAEIHFYVSGGCDAATGAKEEHQVSNQMLPHGLVDWRHRIGSDGLLALKRLRRLPWQARSARRWRCWSGNGAEAVSGRGRGWPRGCAVRRGVPGLSAAGLVILAVAQMCWRVYWHASGRSSSLVLAWS